MTRPRLAGFNAIGALSAGTPDHLRESRLQRHDLQNQLMFEHKSAVDFKILLDSMPLRRAFLVKYKARNTEWVDMRRK